MKKLFTVMAVMMLSLFVSISAVRAEEGWLDNVDEALKTAEKENKYVFLDFSGSDW